MKKVILSSFILVSFLVPVKSYNNNLSNYGVKDRTIAPSVISNTVSEVKFIQENGYAKLSKLVPYIREASKVHRVPDNVLAAVLYEEIIHRKPVDIKTFGVAQLGVGELVEQGLPPKSYLLENDELSVWLLAKQLRRLQDKTGSLSKAIILHNGYYDFYDSVKIRAKDKRLIMLLKEKKVYIVTQV